MSAGGSARPQSAGRHLALLSREIGVRGRGARRDLEEELEPPPLTPIPVLQANLASALERQVAEALGIPDKQPIPRLPPDTESCRQGGKCCWRWLARAAVDHISGEPTAHAPLPQMVQTLKEEVTFLRTQHVRADVAEGRAQVAEQALSALRVEQNSSGKELTELRAMQRQLGRLQAENESLQVNSGRHAAVVAGLQDEAARQRQDAADAKRKSADAELRLETMQQLLSDQKSVEEELRKKLLHLEKELSNKEYELSKANDVIQGFKKKKGKKSASPRAKGRMASPRAKGRIR